MSQLFIIIFFSMQFSIAAGSGAGEGFVAMMGLLLVQGVNESNSSLL